MIDLFALLGIGIYAIGKAGIEGNKQENEDKMAFERALRDDCPVYRDNKGRLRLTLPIGNTDFVWLGTVETGPYKGKKCYRELGTNKPVYVIDAYPSVAEWYENKEDGKIYYTEAELVNKAKAAKKKFCWIPSQMSGKLSDYYINVETGKRYWYNCNVERYPCFNDKERLEHYYLKEFSGFENSLKIAKDNPDIIPIMPNDLYDNRFVIKKGFSLPVNYH